LTSLFDAIYKYQDISNSPCFLIRAHKKSKQLKFSSNFNFDTFKKQMEMPLSEISQKGEVYALLREVYRPLKNLYQKHGHNLNSAQNCW